MKTNDRGSHISNSASKKNILKSICLPVICGEQASSQRVSACFNTISGVSETESRSHYFHLLYWFYEFFIYSTRTNENKYPNACCFSHHRMIPKGILQYWLSATYVVFSFINYTLAFLSESEFQASTWLFTRATKFCSRNVKKSRTQLKADINLDKIAIIMNLSLANRGTPRPQDRPPSGRPGSARPLTSRNPITVGRYRVWIVFNWDL